MSKKFKLALYQTATGLAHNGYRLETGYETREVWQEAKTPENIKAIYDHLVKLFSEEVKPS